MIDKNDALELLTLHLKDKNLIKHSKAVACVMETLAHNLNQNTDEWYLTGLLHDIDYNQTFDKPEKHGIIAMELLNDLQLPQYMLDSIRRHSGNEKLESLSDKALWCADPVTGLIIATALMNPEKSIKAINLQSLKKKFKNLKFAAGANRQQIASCIDINMELDDFLELSIKAMATIDDELLS